MKRLMSYLIAGLYATLIPAVGIADYLKVTLPPDVDKSGTIKNDQSCWRATAANMLAGAGYGTGVTIQKRAEGIYNEISQWTGPKGTLTMQSAYNPADAIKWWLNNKRPASQKSNPYKVSYQYGSGLGFPAAKSWPFYFANELRSCNIEGMLLEMGNSQVGHWITVWGDNGADVPNLTTAPSEVWVTDSDVNSGQAVQKYTYSQGKYENSTTGKKYPNRWKLNYSGDGWVIANAHLKPTQKSSTVSNVQLISDSLTLPVMDPKDPSNQEPALDLHYRVGTDVDILSYRTTVSWPTTAGSPNVTEIYPPSNPYPRDIDVDWDFPSGNPPPHNTKVTINTEFAVPEWNSIHYTNHYFTYDAGKKGSAFPGFDWNLTTPADFAAGGGEPIGGFVIGGFDFFADPGGIELLAEYRLQHQYDYWQNPEQHEFDLLALDDGPYYVGNFRFGHSYGYLDSEDLLIFDDWMTLQTDFYLFVPNDPIFIDLDWAGLLPYPTYNLIPEPASLSLLVLGWFTLMYRKRK